MKIRPLILAVASVFSLTATPALAHGGAPHILGTVKSVQSGSLTVETPRHKDVTVKLAPDTRYEQGKTAVTVKDVAPGERVVVHTRRENGGLTAIEIHLAPAHAHATHAARTGGTAK